MMENLIFTDPRAKTGPSTLPPGSDPVTHKQKPARLAALRPLRVYAF